MCSSKSTKHKQQQHYGTPKVAQIDGRPVLQPTSNQVPSFEKRNPIKKIASPKFPTTNVAISKSSLSPPISPKLKSPRPPAVKRANNPNELSSSTEKIVTPVSAKRLGRTSSVKKKPKSTSNNTVGIAAATYDSSLIVEAPGSIAAARREQVAIMQEQRKLRTAHYGRTKSAKYEGKVSALDSLPDANMSRDQQKRCSFITPNTDPIYVVYHDEEWGVPVHDDKLLFELLVLTAAQVGSDWTSVLKKRQLLREAFAGFDAEVVSKFPEKKMTSISSEYGLEISKVRGVVDNANRILEVKKEMGSFEKYLWGFVNHKAINKQYRSREKIPVKTSKSESISKDMVKRGFRFVGPTVIHLLMQAAGLTNDHLINCSRHLQCTEGRN